MADDNEDDKPLFCAEHGTVKQKNRVVEPDRRIMRKGPRYGETLLVGRKPYASWLHMRGMVGQYDWCSL